MRGFLRLSIQLLLAFFILQSSTHAQTKPIQNNRASAKYVRGVYRVHVGHSHGFAIWIVDGAVIRHEIYHEFVYGGNVQRYPWTPKQEIFIDNAISADEYEYTLAHELYERDLMAKRGLSYDEAHDSALMLEHRMRLRDLTACKQHEAELPLVSTLDDDSVRELPLPDSIRLKDIYRQHLAKRDGIAIWIVDGPTVRREIYPDFGMSGNDKVYFFIPKGEIWIDNSASCEETEYSIASELEERKLMANGIGYDLAYQAALKIVIRMRDQTDRLISRMRPIEVVQPTDRDFGTGSEPGAVVVDY
jgi:hypothetical protein